MMKWVYIAFFLLIAIIVRGQVPDVGSLIKVHEITKTQADTISALTSGMLGYNSSDSSLIVRKATSWQKLGLDRSSKNELVESIVSNADSFKIFQNTNSLISSENSVRVYMGQFDIKNTGNYSVTSLPFKPSRLEFIAFANVDTINLNRDNGVGDNNATKDNVFGIMKGSVQTYNGAITQQAIFIGASARSLNDISRFASNSHCIGLRYANTNGDNIGETKASFVSFNTNGFTINVGTKDDNVLVMYTAFR